MVKVYEDKTTDKICSKLIGKEIQDAISILNTMYNDRQATDFSVIVYDTRNNYCEYWGDEIVIDVECDTVHKRVGIPFHSTDFYTFYVKA